MQKIIKKLVLILVIALTLGSLSQAFALDVELLDGVLTDTKEYIYNTVKNPQVGSIGGEWTILGLSRSDYTVPKEYYKNYYKAVEDYLKDCNGILHAKKYTEYSRVVIALTAIGKDPTNVAGYNLLTPLADYDKVVWQGLNGAIWALLALDSGNYDMPKNYSIKNQANREVYINYILEKQLADGGFSLTGEGQAEPDITGMVLQALAKYREQEKVENAIAKAIVCLSNLQNSAGGFESFQNDNSESVIQVIVALTELHIPLDDTRFVKNNNTLIDNFMNYYIKGEGFKHTLKENSTNLMATEQALYSLVAIDRAIKGKNTLYNMNDSIKIADKENQNQFGLTGKNKAIKLKSVIQKDKSFKDIQKHKNQFAIEELLARKIINGIDENVFAPDKSMTRAEFATIVVNCLGLEVKNNNIFKDFSENDWFSKAVNTAYSYGIVKGTSETTFNPQGEITREEAAVMVARASKLCGLSTDMGVAATRDILAGFTDYIKASSWARSSLAFCYAEDILSNEDIKIMPKSEIARAEIAQMIYNVMAKAKLI